jgi:hypothetical protein
MFDRGTSDRRADRGVSRDIGEPGTAFSEATRLDALWWAGTAVQIFSRLPRGPGAGGGSTLEQNTGLAQQLMSCFGALATDSLLLGAAFGVPSGNKAELRDAVAGAVARLATPALVALSSRSTASQLPQVQVQRAPTDGPGPPPAGPAASPLTVNGKTSGYYPQESRCIHGRGFSDSGRLSCVSKHRYWTYDTFRQSPKVKAKGKVKEFTSRADIQQGIWSNRYAAATVIANRAQGRFEIDDDFYPLPNRDEYGGLPSDKLIGDVVHEHLQWTYLNHLQLASHAIVSEESRRVSYFVGGAPGARPISIPFWELVTKNPEPEAINSLAFSLGSPNWHLRPDIVDISSKQIFEIKPIRSVHKGVLQLWRYVSNFRMAWTYDDIVSRRANETKWRVYELSPGFVPKDVLRPVQLYPMLRNRGVGKSYDKYKKVWVEPLMFSSLPGVIAYRLREGNPEDDYKKIPDIIKAIIKALLIAAALLAVAYAFIAALPVLLPVAVAIIGLIAKVGSGLIEIIQPDRRPVLPAGRDVAAALGEALRTETADLAKEAAEIVMNADLRSIH